MRKLIVSTIVAFTLGAGAATVYADSHTNQQAQGTSVTVSGNNSAVFGVVDVKRVISESSQLKALKSQLEPKHKEIMNLQNDLTANLTKLNKNEAVLSNAQKEKLKQKIVAQRNDLMALQTDFFKRRNTVFKNVIAKVKDIVASVAQEKGINLVFFKEALVYAKAGADVDITNSVIERINANS